MDLLRSILTIIIVSLTLAHTCEEKTQAIIRSLPSNCFSLFFLFHFSIILLMGKGRSRSRKYKIFIYQNQKSFGNWKKKSQMDVDALDFVGTLFDGILTKIFHDWHLYVNAKDLGDEIFISEPNGNSKESPSESYGLITIYWWTFCCHY